MKKWSAEGQQQEIQTVLGYIINTRAFMVALPRDKAIAYAKQITEILVANKVSHKNLETIIGRIAHTSYVVPNAKFFIP